MDKLTLDKIVFYSQKDEEALFTWFRGISAIRKICGEGQKIILSVNNDISDNDLREILAVFFRYGADMRQLADLKNENNEEWFMDSKMYWYESVFS
jgi:hypothetical protein